MEKKEIERLIELLDRLKVYSIIEDRQLIEKLLIKLKEEIK